MSARFAHAKNAGWFTQAKTRIAFVFFISSALLVVFSYFYSSIFLILGALGLAVWGAMLLLATTQKVVKVNLVKLIMTDSIFAFDSLLSRFGYDGMAIIEPPMTIGGNPSLRIFKATGNEESISLMPLGSDLAFLIEKKSPIDLFSVEFDILSEFLSKMFTDEFELSSGFVMTRENEQIIIRMKDFIFQDLCEQLEKSNSSCCKKLLYPICGSLACIISKVTHKSVSLDKVLFSSKNTVELRFLIH